MADKLNELFATLKVFPHGWLLDLGDGFPVTNYSFSQILFGGAKVVNRLDCNTSPSTTQTSKTEAIKTRS